MDSCLDKVGTHPPMAQSETLRVLDYNEFDALRRVILRPSQRSIEQSSDYAHSSDLRIKRGQHRLMGRDPSQSLSRFRDDDDVIFVHERVVRRVKCLHVSDRMLVHYETLYEGVYAPCMLRACKKQMDLAIGSADLEELEVTPIPMRRARETE